MLVVLFVYNYEICTFFTQRNSYVCYVCMYVALQSFENVRNLYYFLKKPLLLEKLRPNCTTMNIYG